jgi:hypothetical protein
MCAWPSNAGPSTPFVAAPGTYNPCIRFLYSQPDALDAASLTAIRTCLSAGALLLPLLLGWLGSQLRGTQEGRSAAAALLADDGADGESAAPSAGAWEAGLAQRQQALEGSAGGAGAGAGFLSGPLKDERLGPLLTTTFTSVVLGGLVRAPTGGALVCTRQARCGAAAAQLSNPCSRA